ncbi:GNAT family N-acetyltransferase [Ammoniphilus resinae]|uniref:Ribosomal-protein-alanine N-acetyltransferase n=1 Tax=Ammoniphilus resinae TaxID=861532 RepID=A0ABS4GUI7_9BACL|nr:GNAT family N-acetyltransferase [Ammoniphilus resinae]MBP1933712.1 ribosomal-protein-alanine N-acetyltransferase [Ammoniphilus resinae]
MILRPLEEKDTEALFELFKEEKGANWIDFPITSLQRFKGHISELLAGEFLGFAVPRVILDPVTQKIAGLILLTNIDTENQSAEMGTWLGFNYRGSGLNQQAKAEMIQYAFTELNLAKILLVTAEQNIASIKAIAKLPYTCKTRGDEYGALKKHYAFLYRKNILIYKITHEDFFAKK